MPTKAAIYQARRRLGTAPLRRLFAEVARPLAIDATRGAWLEGWRLMSIDGTTFDLADTPANDGHFGRPGHSRGEGSAWPQARMVGLAEVGTHAIVAAAVGPYATGERRLTEQVLGGLGPGMLCLADRGFYSFDLWNQARQTATGTHGSEGVGRSNASRLPDRLIRIVRSTRS